MCKIGDTQHPNVDIAPWPVGRGKPVPRRATSESRMIFSSESRITRITRINADFKRALLVPAFTCRPYRAKEEGRHAVLYTCRPYRAKEVARADDFLV